MVDIPKQAIDAVAKAIADSIGHGMSEKCFDHARAALTAAAPHMSGSAREQALEEAETQGNLKQWNIQDHLKTPGSIAEYLQATLDEGDSELLINAVSDVIRALTAAAPHISGVKVKQLEWVATGQTGFLETEFYAVAGSLMHTVHPLKDVDGAFNEHYSIHRDWNDREVWRVTYYVGNNGLSGISKVCKSLEAAKAAAQADYEKRILSALEPSSAREQALEEAAKLIEEGFEKAVGQAWRNDGKPSKNDRCPHGKFMYEDCERCASDAIRALKSQPHTGGGE